MNKFSRFIPSYEKEQYEDVFAKAAFTDVLSELNLGEPENTDIVKVTHSDEGSTVIEINKLMSFGNKAQVILKQYEAKSESQTDTAEVVQVWVQNGAKVVTKEYVNGELNLEQPVEIMHDVYKDYVKIPEVAEEHEELLAEIMYDPTSCISSGSCCYFEGQRYEHCGKSCGIYNNAGGGTPINAIDRCCVTHDRDLQGPMPRISVCDAHKKLIKCMDGLKGPGDTTIRTGIRADALLKGCGFI
ncbi:MULTISPECIES: hypothetical protein [Solibacillus]|uniref:Phospholipase A2 domain-containing protein n=1 Tax=Solibacillus merdavium TaxID=2762218 RepID=A0ABR8XS80_9BACL|nr:hypothetical protein [Solibacillus merdavium]MBD8034795.1 hypothetical protein [Solibacillus merdavium]